MGNIWRNEAHYEKRVTLVKNGSQLKNRSYLEKGDTLEKTGHTWKKRVRLEKMGHTGNNTNNG